MEIKGAGFTFRIATLGCKVNQRESEELAERFCALGFLPAEKGEAASVCVINSCAVTAVSDAKTRQRIRQARAQNPDALVCVIGCLPEVSGDAVSAMEETDLVIGSAEKERTAELALAALESRGAVSADYGGAGRGAEARGQNKIAVSGAAGFGVRGERTRAFIKAEDGCDRFCAYCVIPYARGGVRSKPFDEVLREAEGRLAAGYRELTLTGINLALYGRDFRGGDARDLYALVEGLVSLDCGREYRVRLGSLEPTAIDAEGAARIAALPNVCPQFHLSLQSGAARTLCAMGRAYTPESYMDIVTALRARDALFSITTDVIVGFPGETDADFEESLAFVKRAAFARVHVFPFSPRPNARAAGMPNQVESAVKAERAGRMNAAAKESETRFLAMNSGAVRRTLIYGKDKNGRTRGLTDNGICVLPDKFGGAELRANSFADVVMD